MDLNAKFRAFIDMANNLVKYLKNKISDKRTIIFLLGAFLSYRLYKFPLHITSSDFMKLVKDNQVDSVCYLGFLLCFKLKGTGQNLLTNYATNNVDTFNQLMSSKNIQYNHFHGYESMILNPYNQLFGITFLFSYMVFDNIKDSFNTPKSKYYSKDRSLSEITKVFDNIVTSKETKDQFILTIDQLLNAEKYKINRIKPIKGVLLYGKPGTGKTLVAKVSICKN